MEMSVKYCLSIAVALVSGVALAVPVVEAAPVVASAVTAPAAQPAVTQIQYRGWRGDRGHYRGGRGYDRGGRGVGPFLGGLAAGAVIGGALGQRSYGYDGGGGSEDGMARCSANFRSFDPSTGTYTTYGGETRRCPYL